MSCTPRLHPLTYLSLCLGLRLGSRIHTSTRAKAVSFIVIWNHTQHLIKLLSFYNLYMLNALVIRILCDVVLSDSTCSCSCSLRSQEGDVWLKFCAMSLTGLSSHEVMTSLASPFLAILRAAVADVRLTSIFMLCL